MPHTVHGAITSRIDRLSPTQQLTVKVASVIGRVFAVVILRDVHPLREAVALHPVRRPDRHRAGQPDRARHPRARPQLPVQARDRPGGRLQPDAAVPAAAACTARWPSGTSGRAAATWPCWPTTGGWPRCRTRRSTTWSGPAPRPCGRAPTPRPSGSSPPCWRSTTTARAARPARAAAAGHARTPHAIRRARWEHQLGDAYLGLGQLAPEQEHLHAALALLGPPDPGQRPPAPGQAGLAGRPAAAQPGLAAAPGRPLPRGQGRPGGGGRGLRAPVPGRLPRQPAGPGGAPGGQGPEPGRGGRVAPRPRPGWPPPARSAPGCWPATGWPRPTCAAPSPPSKGPTTRRPGRGCCSRPPSTSSGSGAGRRSASTWRRRPRSCAGSATRGGWPRSPACASGSGTSRASCRPCAPLLAELDRLGRHSGDAQVRSWAVAGHAVVGLRTGDLEEAVGRAQPAPGTRARGHARPPARATGPGRSSCCGGPSSRPPARWSSATGSTCTPCSAEVALALWLDRRGRGERRRRAVAGHGRRGRRPPRPLRPGVPDRPAAGPAPPGPARLDRRPGRPGAAGLAGRPGRRRAARHALRAGAGPGHAGPPRGAGPAPGRPRAGARPLFEGWGSRT